jgi:hypothetical protein
MSQVGAPPPQAAPASLSSGNSGEPDRLRPSAWAHSRDPRDLRSLLWFGLITVLGVLAARGAEQTTAGLEGDLVQLVSGLPEVVFGFLIVAVQAAYVLLFLGIRWLCWSPAGGGGGASTPLDGC